MNASLEALYTLSTSIHGNSCKTQQGVRDGSPKMKVGSAAASLMEQHSPHSTPTGNFIIYQILYVLMRRNEHSHGKAVIKRWLSEHLSLDKAVRFSQITQRPVAPRMKQGTANFPFSQCLGCCPDSCTYHRGHLDCQEQGQLAINLCSRGCLRQLASLWAQRLGCMWSVHLHSEFQTGCLYRQISSI